MTAVWKWKINYIREKIEIPRNTKIVSAALDPEGKCCIWGLVDTEEEETEKINVVVAGTGWEYYDDIKDMTFLNTVKDGDYMFHIFYKKIGKEE